MNKKQVFSDQVFSDVEKYVCNSSAWEAAHDHPCWGDSRREYEIELGVRRCGWHRLVVECPPARNRRGDFLVIMRIGSGVASMPQIRTVGQLKNLLNGISGVTDE